jgi:hypothetical protein
MQAQWCELLAFLFLLVILCIPFLIILITLRSQSGYSDGSRVSTK